VLFIIVTVVATLFVNGTLRTAGEQEIKPLPSIAVTAPNDVAMVEGINDTLAALSEKVTACVKGGRKLEACQCAYPQDLGRLRKGYQTLIEQHPEWKDQLSSYHYVNKEGRNISGTLVLQNLRRQLDVLKCEETVIKLNGPPKSARAEP
jgi:hypothetical protein